MRKTVLALVVIGSLVAGAGLAAQARSAADLYQEALQYEEIKGDLQRAIATYQTILERFASDRSVAAKAQFHLALCYERLGRPEAAAAYEKLVREYPTEREFVTQAQDRLAALRSRSVALSGAALVERQQVWTGGVEVNFEGFPSADGRYLTFVDYSSTGTPGAANVAVRDLTTGQNRLITRETKWGESRVSSPVLSPDNALVAYGWLDDNGKGDDFSIRAIGLDGSGMRTVARFNADGADLAWSPDGRQLAAMLYGRDETRRLGVINASDGKFTQLLSAGQDRSAVLGGFSPDGRWLLFTARPPGTSPTDTNADILAIAIDGSRQVTLVGGPGRDSHPYWTPDGSAVIFRSDRSGSPGLWAVRVAGGSAVGDPFEIRTGIGSITPLGLTRRGSYVYGVATNNTDVHVATIDPSTLRVTSASRPLSDRGNGSTSTPRWSPNGRLIAFLRGSSNGSQSIVIRSMADGVERTLPTKILSPGRTVTFGFSWFPDSRSVLIRDRDSVGPTDANGKAVIRRIDVDTGKDVTLFTAGDWDVWAPLKLSPDGKALFYTAFDRDTARGVNHLRLIRRDLETGLEVELRKQDTEYYAFYGLMVSPDGSRLAFLENLEGRPRTLLTLPASGGVATEIVSTSASPVRPIDAVGTGYRAWTPDGRYIVTMAKDNSGAWAFPIDGSAPRKLDWPLSEVGDISPDGTQTALTVSRQLREIRTIENLLTRISTTK